MEESLQLSAKIQEEAEKAYQAMRKGLVILYPTDTIWGLGCDIENESAVIRIFEIKNRPKDKPFIILVDSIEMLKKYVTIHPRIETLLTFHSKPLTIIYPEAKNLPSYLLAPSGSIAIRIAQSDFCKELIHKLGKPIVSTSANRSGEPYPKSYEEISKEILNMSDYVVDNDESLQEDMDRNPSIIATFNHKGELNFLRT